MATLILSQPDGSEVPVPLGEGLIRVGRDPENELRIDDESISSFHAEIVLADGFHVLRDLGSTNGVRINGERVHEARLSDGDLVRFGAMRAHYHGQAPAGSSAKAAGPAGAPAGTPAAAKADAPAPMPAPASSAGAVAGDGNGVPAAKAMRGKEFRTKKPEKNPETTLYVVVAVIVGLAALAAILLSFTMR